MTLLLLTLVGLSIVSECRLMGCLTFAYLFIGMILNYLKQSYKYLIHFDDPFELLTK